MQSADADADAYADEEDADEEDADEEDADEEDTDADARLNTGEQHSPV